MQLNADTPLVQPGQMLIVADPRNHNQSTPIAALMQAKSRTSKAVKAGDSDFSTFLHRNYAAIAAFTSYGETVVGLASDAGERYFSQIKNILVEIENLPKSVPHEWRFDWHAVSGGTSAAVRYIKTVTESPYSCSTQYERICANQTRAGALQ